MGLESIYLKILKSIIRAKFELFSFVGFMAIIALE